MLLAEALRQGRLPPATRALVMEAALRSATDPAIRDLFEAFLPEEQRTQRLGDVISPDELLKLQGDLSRGRQLFHESTVVQCRSCHRIDGKGTALGPDLDAIGKKYDRGKLLESILQPSLQIDPKYATWLVETSSGKIYTGLLLERNAEGVALIDAQNNTHRIKAADLEGVFPQTKSMMPDLLLRDFTAQQVADLLEYLTSLKGE
jgi:putative heme-binding domain-containing protein